MSSPTRGDPETSSFAGLRRRLSLFHFREVCTEGGDYKLGCRIRKQRKPSSSNATDHCRGWIHRRLASARVFAA
jgi:hypothetical protein